MARRTARKSQPRQLSVASLRIELLEDRMAPAGIVAVGSGPGGPPVVRVFDALTGSQITSFLAYDSHFLGGVRVALGDVTGDGVPDIITAAGPGGGPQVNVYNGATFALITSFYAYAPQFGGGVNVAIGNLNNVGVNDIITGAGAGGGPHVKVFNVINGQAVQASGPLGSFYAYDPGFAGGVNVAVSDVNGQPELVTGAGPGGGPHVKVFAPDGTLKASFYAYPSAFSGGVYVASDDVNADGIADVITGPGAGGTPQVEVFSGKDGSLLDSFYAYNPLFSGGVRVAAGDVNGDGHADIVTAAGPGGGPHARVFDGQTLNEITGFYALDQTFAGGIYCAGATLSALDSLDGFVVNPEAPLLSRLARFVPSAIPSLSNWTTVSAADTNLDAMDNGGKTNIYVIAHGWAPGFATMVEANGTPSNPLKWWQTLDTSLMDSPGTPASPEMFYGSSGDGIQISPSGLAYAITQADPKAIVLAYSWIDNSATDNFGDVPKGAYQSEAYTALNGTRLADALELALPGTFHADGGQLHLIGHSHGSKVATVAADVLTATKNSNLAVAHLTILDSPETDSTLVSDSDSANNLWYFLSALNIGRSSGQTFVDNYISELDKPLGVIQGANPFDTSSETSVLQQIVDVNLNGRVLLDFTDVGDLHAYAFNWYGGASLAWAQNPSPNVADQWSPLINPATPATLAGSYTQSWSTFTQPQFALKVTSQTNTVTDTPAFNNLAFPDPMLSGGATYNANSGTVNLTENGTGTSSFTGTFVPEKKLAGISFNYQFGNVGMGDQLVISVDSGYTTAYYVYYVMTGTVAGTTAGIGTLSLSSLAGSSSSYHVEMELKPLTGSSGASVSITNIQEFTS
jgi:hypothetical protein